MDYMIPNYTDELQKNHDKNDVVARWLLPIRGKLYDVELEHGKISGKRVIWVNGEEVLRRDMMYRLVGEDTFFLEEKRCIIHIIPSTGFKYHYKLFVEGVEYETFNKNQLKVLKTWQIKINDKMYRIVLEKDTLNIYLNGDLRDEKPEFVNDGTETSFTQDDHIFILSAGSSTNRSEGICYNLTVNGALYEVPEIPLSISN